MRSEFGEVCVFGSFLLNKSFTHIHVALGIIEYFYSYQHFVIVEHKIDWKWTLHFLFLVFALTPASASPTPLPEKHPSAVSAVSTKRLR
jgi:hypothetical protein